MDRTGYQPLPKRIVITYFEEEGQPQFWAELSNWNLSPVISDDFFLFTPPNGAERIQFMAQIGRSASIFEPEKGGKK